MKAIFTLTGMVAIAAIVIAPIACRPAPPSATDTGITKASANIQTGIDGLTVEQRNVKKRLEVDNLPGSVKHLYVFSAFSGQVLIYSTVDGKVTSSAKRLSPAIVSSGGDYPDSIPVRIGNSNYHTPEVLQDDGTYGSSVPYLYWFDTKGNYHQHYVGGGQIVHVSDEPLAVTDVVIRIGTDE